jgi:hypothetical protein
MAIESSANAPVNPPDAASPVDKPVQKSERAGLSEAALAATRAKEPPHLLTPLAALWPAATRPEPPKTQEKVPTPTAARTVKVTFVLFEPDAKQVVVSGNFNGWSIDATPMKRDEAGQWETTVALAPGRHEYKFVVDGNWKHDPLARVNVRNQNGTLNSVAQVWP